MKRSHHVEIRYHKALEATQRRRKTSRAFGAAGRLSTTGKPMGHALGTSVTSAPMKQTRRVEIEAQEGSWTSQRSRDASRVFGTAETLPTAPNDVVDLLTDVSHTESDLANHKRRLSLLARKHVSSYLSATTPFVYIHQRLSFPQLCWCPQFQHQHQH